MEPLFRKMIATLTEARSAVSEELDQLVKIESQDTAAVEHLRGSVRSFGVQADSLVLTIEEREPTGPLLERASDLSDFFEAADSELESLLAASRGSAREHP